MPHYDNMFNRDAAKRVGYTDQEIDEYLKQHGQGNQLSGQLSVQSIQQPEKPKENLISKFANFFLEPAKQYGRLLGEAGAQTFRTATDPAFRKLFLNQEITPEEARRVSQAKPTFFLKPEEVKDITKTGLKATAGAASYVVPGGGTVGQMLTRGALAGGLLGFAEDRDITTSALGGAAGGVIGGVTIPWAFRKASQLFGGTGGKLATGIAKPKVQPSPFAAEEEKAIVEGLNKLGIKGSAQAQREAIPIKFRELGDEITDLLKVSPQSVNKKTITEGIDTALESTINYDPTIPAYEKAAEKFINQVTKGAKRQEIPASILFKAKQNLGKQLSRAFTKIEKGNPLTPQEEVGIAIWGAIDDLLPQNVKVLTRLQSLLYKASPGLQKSAIGEAGPRIFGMQVLPTSLVQGTQSLAGRAATAIGGVTQKIGVAIPPRGGAIAGTLAGTRMAAGKPELSEPQAGLQFEGGKPVISQPQPQQEILSPQGQWRWDAEHNDWVPNEKQVQAQIPTKEQFNQAILNDLQTNGGKNVSKLKTAYEFIVGKEGGLSAEQAKKVAQLNTGMVLIDQFEEMLSEIESSNFGPEARVTGITKNLMAGLGLDPNVKTFNDVRSGTMALLVRALGEVGTLNEGDIRRAVNLIPTVGQTPEERRLHFVQIRTILEKAEEDVRGQNVRSETGISNQEDLFLE